MSRMISHLRNSVSMPCLLFLDPALDLQASAMRSAGFLCASLMPGTSRERRPRRCHFEGLVHTSLQACLSPILRTSASDGSFFHIHATPRRNGRASAVSPEITGLKWIWAAGADPTSGATGEASPDRASDFLPWAGTRMTLSRLIQLGLQVWTNSRLTLDEQPTFSVTSNTPSLFGKDIGIPWLIRNPG